MPKPISEKIENLNFQLEKLNFILKEFPDAKFSQYKDHFTFSSKSVNSKFTKCDFQKDHYSLAIKPYVELEFTYNGKVETIKVNSSPTRNSIAYISFYRDPVHGGKRSISFNRYLFNLKKHNFKDEVIYLCKNQIIDFIKDHPGHHLDTRNLDDRLKQLITFI